MPRHVTSRHLSLVLVALDGHVCAQALPLVPLAVCLPPRRHDASAQRVEPITDIMCTHRRREPPRRNWVIGTGLFRRGLWSLRPPSPPRAASAGWAGGELFTRGTARFRSVADHETTRRETVAPRFLPFLPPCLISIHWKNVFHRAANADKNCPSALCRWHTLSKLAHGPAEWWTGSTGCTPLPVESATEHLKKIVWVTKRNSRCIGCSGAAACTPNKQKHVVLFSFPCSEMSVVVYYPYFSRSLFYRTWWGTAAARSARPRLPDVGTRCTAASPSRVLEPRARRWARRTCLQKIEKIGKHAA